MKYALRTSCPKQNVIDCKCRIIEYIICGSSMGGHTQLLSYYINSMIIIVYAHP